MKITFFNENGRDVGEMNNNLNRLPIPRLDEIVHLPRYLGKVSEVCYLFNNEKYEVLITLKLLDFKGEV